MDQSVPESHLDIPVDISPPASLSVPLWRSLLQGLKDRFAPGHLPPLQVTSEPVDVGMLLGDVLGLPWFRTVFTSVGDVISPETLPPLQVESRPVDVGELISDQMSHPWWSSLIRNLADRVSPERMPAMVITSSPVNPEQTSELLLVPRWSHLIDTPKVFYPDIPVSTARLQPRIPRPAPLRKPAAKEDEFTRVLTLEKQGQLRRSRIREAMWISVAVIEVAALVAGHFLAH
ncbi:MAG TPA: hypothetical protein VKW78_16395 [Terriglobales bacterium]|nr:hypothetical protein [Terriglobales bacterium]